MDTIEWLQQWYLNHCNDDWEHQYGITIETLDNPGWNVKIDLKGTGSTMPDEDWKQVESSEQDWYGYKIKDNVFEASGDPMKLGFLLQLFRERVNGTSPNK